MISKSRSHGGFTLVEVIVASTLSALVMAAVLSSFLFMGRNLARLANYQTLENKSRQALTYLRRDFALAQSVKTGTTPSSTTVTLVLPAGEVTYTYDGPNYTLHRQANFGPNADFYLLKNDYCICTIFGFNYYTTSGSLLNPLLGTIVVPYSVKQIEVRFVIRTPDNFSPAIQTIYETASSRFLIRNKQLPDGN